MSIIHNNSIVGSSGNQVTTYDITKSLRFRQGASASLTRTPSVAGNRQTWTWSAWVKRGRISTGVVQYLIDGRSGTNMTALYFTDQDALQFEYYDGSLSYYQVTSAVYRDPSAWYHIVAVFDTTNATASNRMRIYVNGVQVTSFIAAGYPIQNLNGWVNNTNAHAIGARTLNSNYIDGYMAEVNFIDGQALTPASFGESDAITGVWKPKRYAGSYGTNGFKLDFSDNSAATAAAIGNDSSGNGNNWTPNNISVTAGATYDSMTDVPTLTSATAANYCVLNPLDTGSNITLSAGNLQTSQGAAAGISKGTIGVSTGKWYWEVTLTSGYNVIGIATPSTSRSDNYVGKAADSYGYYSSNGYKYNNNVSFSYGASFTTGDVIGVALNMDAGTLEFFKNGTSQGTAYSSLSGTYMPALGNDQANTNTVNFGQRPFTYTPPSGFKALNTFNLPDSAIPAGNKVMDAVAYAGTGSTRTVTNGGSFKPDFAWLKSRTSGTAYHILADSIRGGGKSLYSNSTLAEGTNDGSGYVSAFASDGFTVTAGASGSGDVNASGSNYVGWQWQAGQGTTSSNTSGSITSTVSANPSAGFSIVTYTGTGASGGTVGHGLGVAPSLIIAKHRTDTYGWPVYHKSLGGSAYLSLNTTDAAGSISNYWGTPNSTTFGVWANSGAANNASGGSYVAYCWSEVAGFSKFGSYTGNGSADGPFVYTGFRPRFIMFKCSSSSESGNADWGIIDTSRSPRNYALQRLWANLSSTEADNAAYPIDILSNGFKLRDGTSGYGHNTSGNTYIYMAFAENPFKNSLAR